MIIIFFENCYVAVRESDMTTLEHERIGQLTDIEKHKIALEIKEKRKENDKLNAICYDGKRIIFTERASFETRKLINTRFNKPENPYGHGMVENHWQPLRFKRGDRVWFKGEWWYVSDTMTDTHANWTYSLFRDLENYWKGTETVWRGQEDEVQETKSGQTDIFDFMEES